MKSKLIKNGMTLLLLVAGTMSIQTTQVLAKDMTQMDSQVQLESRLELPNTSTQMRTTTRLNMRTGAGTKYRVAQTLATGTIVTSVQKLSNGWNKVTVAGKTGYVLGKYLTSVSVASSSPDSVVLPDSSGERWTAASLNMRKGIGTKYGKLVTIPKGAKVELISGIQNGWYKVSYSGKTGYVSGKYLTSKKPSTSTSTKSSGYSAMKIYLPNKTVSYQNGGKANGQTIIDKNIKVASTWGGAQTFSGSDGMNTHIVGHSHGAFNGLWNYSIGQNITMTDANGTPTIYKITEKLLVDDYGIRTSDGANLYNYIVGTGGGEVLTLQTCKTSAVNWIIRAEKIN